MIAEPFMLDTSVRTTGMVMSVCTNATDIPNSEYCAAIVNYKHIPDKYRYRSRCRVLPANISSIGNNFQSYMGTIPDMPNLKSIRDNFCYENRYLCAIPNMPSLERIGNKFCYDCERLHTFPDLPSLKYVGDDFCYGGNFDKLGSLPLLHQVGDYFCDNCLYITDINLPSVKNIGSHFCYECTLLRSFTLAHSNEEMLSTLQTVGQYFCYRCPKLSLGMSSYARLINEKFK